MPPFRELLRAHREALGWSQVRLARAAGTDHASISHLEAGHRRPTAATVARLAAGLDLDGTERDRLFVAARVLPDDVPADDLLTLLGVARAGEAGLAVLALRLARAARLAAA